MRTVIALVAALGLGSGPAGASRQHASGTTQDAHASAPAKAPAGHADAAEPVKAKAGAHEASVAATKEAPKASSDAKAKEAGGQEVVRAVAAKSEKAGEARTAKAEKPGTVTPTELATRLQKVLDEDAARRKRSLAPASAATSAPSAKRSSAGKPVARPDAVLKWESATEPGGVTLIWDPQIDPRRVRRPAPTGVQLNWPESI